jgi:acyl-CoA dehydrogenase
MELAFEGCRVPGTALLGRSGQGYAIAQRALAACAPLAAALSAGLLAEALDYTLFLARGRRAGNSGLSEFQPLELALAEVMSRLDASLALIWAAAGAVDEALPAAERLARESKWVCTEAAVEGIDALARLTGLEAAIKGAPLERLSRDARAAQLLLGPNHAHRLEVARKMLGRISR